MRKPSQIVAATVAAWLAGLIGVPASIDIQAHYRLGENGVGTDNLPKDSSGNARDFQTGAGATAANVTVSSTSPAPGSTSYYLFNGDMTGFDEIGWDPPEDNIGVECWARSGDLAFITGTTVGSVVFGTGHNQNGIGILYDDFGAGFVGVLGNVDYVGLPYQPASTNEWVHLAVVRDQGVSTFYVNGVARTPTRTGNPINSSIVFMGHGGSLTNFTGAIDEARIFTFNPGEFFPQDLLYYQATNTRPYVTTFKGSATGFVIKLQDKTTSVVTNTIAVTLGGSSVSPAITKAGSVTTVNYVSPSYLPSGSSQTVQLIFTDSGGAVITNNLSFTVAPYISIPASFARAPGSVDTTKKGFRIRPYQTQAANANVLSWTEDQVVGLHGPNIADLSLADADGFFVETNVINFSIEAGSIDRGNFPSDAAFPGLPGTDPSAGATTANASAEVLTFLEFPSAGVYTMGVNSDDGFRVTTGLNPRDRFSLRLGQFDGGRGAADTTFSMLVTQPGIYPFRLLWENGSGELPGNLANLEWFTVTADGTKILLNDSTAPNSLKAYQYQVGSLPAFISRVFPTVNQNGVLPNINSVEVDITDDGTQPNQGSVRMALDAGAFAVPTSIAKTGKVTTAKLALAGQLPVKSTHTAYVAWSDTGTFVGTNSWQFTVLDAFLPPGLWSPLGSGDPTKPGFRVRTFQANYAIQNELPIADQLVHGYAYSDNIADLSTAVNGVFAVPTMVNWNRDAGGSSDVGFFNSPDYPDDLPPGIPGTLGGYENYSMETLAFVEFPTAGIYTMGVNSDDGFRVTVADGTGPDFGGLRIVSPPNLVSNYATWPTYWANGGLFGGPLPKPFPAKAKLVKPNDGTTPNDIYTTDPGDNNASYTFMRARPVNASDLAGNIAVVRRGGGIAFAQKAKYCQDAGAIAVLVVNRPDLAGSLPFGMGGSDASVTIPCVMVDWSQYANFWPSLSTNAADSITVSIGEDCSPLLGEQDGGRGQGTPTIFSFYVPQAGVYPLRLLYFQGGGGANVEWFSVSANGNYVLLNDTSNPAGLKAFRARTIPPGNRGKLNAPVVNGANVTISWTPTGELEEADSVLGPWEKSPDQSSPQTRTAAGKQKYFRLRVY
jgi:hypothetical protein